MLRRVGFITYQKCLTTPRIPVTIPAQDARFRDRRLCRRLRQKTVFLSYARGRSSTMLCAVVIPREYRKRIAISVGVHRRQVAVHCARHGLAPTDLCRGLLQWARGGQRQQSGHK